MERGSYQTIGKYFRYETVKIKGSRFIATAQSVESAPTAEMFIKNIRKEFFNATHNCWAYRLSDNDQFRYHDDGEPSGTAGKPILQAIQGLGLYFSAVVVTRYFGGKKLGTGGLTRAYRQAGIAVLERAKIVTKKLYVWYRIRHDFDQTDPVMHTVSRSGAKIVSMSYDSQAHLKVVVERTLSDALISRLTEATGGKISYEKTGVEYA
ncbi:MAG: hypothetical protein B6244_09680 [Candidatus Cloacimonetes bacterium 4572_55]|nr:MAG: hypothetical protein B6244_09680 [Candidatus Cloacimonetes bacterium 4572_55]